MASNTKSLIDYEAEVHSFLELALKTIDKDFKIKDSQKKRFFENISIKLFHFGDPHFLPVKVYKETNDLGTEFHVGGENSRRKGSSNSQLQLSSAAKTGSLYARMLDLHIVRKDTRDEWVTTRDPIPPGAELRRMKGIDVSICEVEVSLRIPSQGLLFYNRNRKEVKTFFARDVLRHLQGWDESRGSARIEIERKVESEHHKISCMQCNLAAP